MSSLEDFPGIPLDASTETDRLGFGGRLLERLLGNIRYGRLRIELPSGALIEKAGSEPGPDATIVVRRWRMLRRLLTGGDIGFAESYIHGDWATPDLTAAIRFAARNGEALAPAIHGTPLMRLFYRLGNLLNANTKRGSRKNIEAHYDLGNDFYKEWLDPSMLYSSAIWDSATPTLEAAQQRKLERVRQKLALSGGETILEIGCGWGALATHLACKADAKVTGITLSPSQLSWAKDAVFKAGQDEQIDLRLQDYRDTNGQFDRIVSIEMFEAVGEAYWPTYFQTLKRCLKQGGRAVLQIISIEESRFETYRRDTDFIQKYIFPGGFLPSDSALAAEVAKAGLRLTETEHFGKSYARTLAEWRVRFHAHWPAIAALGFDERFRRLWDYYLCYCEAGFEEGAINVGFYTIEHSEAQGAAA
ncbi:class I SAM-dependent methyltransferase (plasmid) [Rhizobium lusitanum]|uniref:SAM-dependent methyltransferase n=1 Tax=Rhizobium lusitanum TaxID=293958 RepID=UPI001607C360|nr:cyclopropane-fatty-acyl-phospholipid synthase family protein [Rhizobium lusitanum]QND46021.1 class I SAM-dependent methyltransferase [Rhizobium lusitanum]